MATTYTYRLRRTGKLFSLICTTQATGCRPTRTIRHTDGVSAMDLCNILAHRDHIKYVLLYKGEKIPEKDVSTIINNPNINAGLLDIQITSELDPNTLARFAEHAMTHTAEQMGKKDTKPTAKYDKPKSKKQVQNSWLYSS